MMTHRGTGLSPVPNARSDSPCQTRIDRHSRATPGPSERSSAPSRRHYGHALAVVTPDFSFLASFRGGPGKVARAPLFTFCPVLLALSLPSGPSFVLSA